MQLIHFSRAGSCRPGSTLIVRVMKITAVILLAACLSAAATGKAQKVSLTLRDAPLEKALKEIKRQTGLDLLYTVDVLQHARPVTIELRNADLRQALDQCFKEQPLTYTIVENVIVVKLRPVTSAEGVGEEIVAAPIDVKGRVVDTAGNPVAGASVTVKGDRTKGTTTDENGYFELKGVDENAVLVVSGVNIERYEVKINGKIDLATLIIKSKITEGQDVIIKANTGYQEIEPNQATGSFAVIDNKTINQQVGTNILKRLDGMTPSILFDNKQLQGQKNSNVTVRGLSSINGPLDPLIVLDGFIYEGDINNINPNTVEEITILKDAAAASIWGTRAGNGVIVITTKRSSYNQKLKINANANVIFNSKPDLFYLPNMSSADYIDMEEFLYHKGVYNQIFNNTNRLPLSPAVEVFRSRSLGQLSSADSATLINSMKNSNILSEYDKYFYTNATTQQYAIGMQSGNSTSSYSLNLAYDRSLSEVYDKSRKINTHFRSSFRPLNNLETFFNVYYTKGEKSSGRPSVGTISLSGRPVPYLRFADDNGNPLPIAYDLRKVYTDTAGAGKLLDWNYYPLDDYKHNVTSTDLTEIFANATIRYSFLKSVNIELGYQYENQRIESDQTQDKESYASRHLVNLFSQVNYTNGNVTRSIPQGGIKRIANNSIESQTLRAQINFDRAWGQHHIIAIVGSEIRKRVASGYSSTTYGYNADPLTNGTVNYATPARIITTNGMRYIPGSPVTNPVLTEKYASLYSNIAYTFNERYVLSLSGRRDGSNVFGANTNDKWKPLWSAGLGWNISQESFYKLEILPELRVRGTYGFSGNIDVTKTALPVAGYSTFNHFLTGLPFGSIGTLNNPDLRWEEIKIINLGIEFSFIKQIVAGTIEFYSKKGSDLYGPAPFDYTAGSDGGTIIKNVANLKSKGLEVTLNTRNIDRDFKWDTRFLYTHQSNKTAAYYSPQATDITQFLGNGDRITPVVGKPLYALAAYRWGGLDDQGNPQGYLNGQKSTDYNAIRDEATIKGVDGNVVYVGSTLPTHFGSLINTFRYKNFSLSLSIMYKLGYYFRKTSLSYDRLIESGVGHREFGERWQKPGDENTTNVPSFVFPNISNRDNFYTLSDVNVLKGDHIRFSFLNLAYNFLNDKLHRMVFSDVQVYFNASNLGIIWHANNVGMDPESPYGLEPTKSWAIGIRASF